MCRFTPENAEPVKLTYEFICAGAYFDHAAARIVSTSYDNTVRVWCLEGSRWEQQTVWKHNNQTGRWLVPFRARWGPVGRSVICGDMSRGVCTWGSPEQAAPSHVLRSEWMTAIPSRFAVDNISGVLAAATSSGRIHLWTPPAPEGSAGERPSVGDCRAQCSVQ